MSIRLLAFLIACRSEETAGPRDLPPRSDCNPVDDAHCMLPWPSDYFLAADESRPSGWRVDLGPLTMPVNLDGTPIDPAYWNEKDGFSTLGTLYAGLAGATLDGVVGHQDLGRYLDPDARTVILDVATGERQPHFVEREVQADSADRSLLMLRPVRPLRHATRYVVGIRGLVDAGGATVDPPAAFAALRDGRSSDDPDVERQRPTYEDVVFPALDAAGFARDELQLAWSFTTISAENSLGRMLWMRDDAIDRVGDDGPPYTITAVTDDDCETAHVGRTIEGTFQAPLYLTDWDPGSVLTRGEDGMPFYNGDVDVPFTIRVPCSLLQDPRPGRLLQYGHGLLGGRVEVRESWMDELADANGWVVFATDWTGMKREDAAYIALMIVEDPSEFAMVPERVMQGWVEAVAAGRMMQGAMAEDEALHEGGVALVDPSSLWFYGNSQGGVLGGGYAAMSTDVERVVLGVPGTPFTLLLTRATGFETFLTMMETMYDDWADISLLIGSFQGVWDPGEAAGYAWFMNQEPLDDRTPAKDVLIQAAIGDGAVPTLGAHVMARAYGATLVTPETRPVWGLEVRAPPFTGSALVERDYGIDEPVEAVPAGGKDDPHWKVRYSPTGQAQIAAFLEDGVVEHTCEGVCDPE